ncbi:MAG TPA: ThuA domain-containing protein [Planctomycetota bacterium]|nr:ThuA domain-containing protein [Planctomycetota bacterium]
MTTLLLLALLQGRDVFDYEGQKAAKDVRKIVLIGDAGTHGPPGNHEFVAGSLILARRIHAAYPNVHAVIHSSKNWPKDLSHADAVVVGLNHGGKAAKDPQIAAAVARGAGFMAIHFGVEVNKGAEGDAYLKWMGGYFETKWSVNPWWTPSFKEFPKHPIARGVTPFSVKDEWYYHMRFVPEMKGVTPILSDVPPLGTVQEKVSDRGGNPGVFKAVSDKQPQHMAWAYERPDGGRGFGFTGMHAHDNWGTDGFRVVLVNGLAWVTKLEIPEAGVASAPVAPEELKKVIEEARAAIAAGR